MANCSGEDIEEGDSGCSPPLGLEPAMWPTASPSLSAQNHIKLCNKLAEK